MRLTRRLTALATTTALAATGTFVTHADAAPLNATAGVTALVAPAATGDFRVLELSPTTARLVGQSAYAGITVDVQILNAKLTPPVWLDIIRWLNTGPTFPTPDDPSTCGTTIHLDRNTTVTIGCNPR